jgi:hypothetical protein
MEPTFTWTPEEREARDTYRLAHHTFGTSQVAVMMTVDRHCGRIEPARVSFVSMGGRADVFDRTLSTLIGLGALVRLSEELVQLHTRFFEALRLGPIRAGDAARRKDAD